MFSELSTIGAINADKKEDGEEEGGEDEQSEMGSLTDDANDSVKDHAEGCSKCKGLAPLFKEPVKARHNLQTKADKTVCQTALFSTP